MPIRTRSFPAMLAVVAVGVAIGFDARAFAQPTPTIKQPGKPVRRGRVAKQPVIDLAKQASERRAGQVLPGDPPPEKFAQPVAEPKPAAPPTPPSPAASVDLPESPKPKPTPVPVSPDAGPRSQPAEPAPKTETPSLAVLRGPKPATRPDSSGQSATIVLSRVDGQADGVEWRLVNDTDWKPPVAGDRADGRYEVRTGLDTEATFAVNNSVTVQVGRLSRVTIELSDSTGLPTVLVRRGSVEVVPNDPSGQALVRSPDRSEAIVASAGARVSYGAFRGTEVQRAQITGIGDR